ncbi:hypothetical protein DSO57_1020502 [Entomophthora muscae]|uniref:Uncharacterized protein n=1 Tax=Entomophthora muscae TaxID=34485 RepID=A0ACC2RIE3_9FUNG|nr:hypothetical protein DSO57_1020502 [Entomophthora muscae]
MGMVGCEVGMLFLFVVIGLVQATRFPAVWQEYLTKMECRDAFEEKFDVPGPRFDKSEVQHLDDPKNNVFQSYLGQVNTQTRKSLSKKLVRVAKLSNHLHKGKTPRFVASFGDRVLFVQSFFSRRYHELVEIKGNNTKILAILSNYDVAPNSTLDYAAFSPRGDAVALAFRPPGKAAGQFVLLSIGHIGVSPIGIGDWDRHPELLVLKDGRSVISNQYSKPDSQADILLRRTRFNRRVRFVSTLFSEPGYYRLSPKIVGKRLCVQAYPFRGMTSSLHCGYLAPGSRCLEADASPKKIAGDNLLEAVTFSGVGKGEQVFFASDHEQDTGAIYLSSSKGIKRVLGPWEKPIIASHVVSTKEYIVARGDYQGVIVEIQMHKLNGTFLFKHATVTQVSIQGKRAIFTLSSLFTPAKIYQWDKGLHLLAEAESPLSQEAFSVEYKQADGVPYTHIRNRTAELSPYCKARLHTGPRLGGSALPRYSASHALTLALLPCNELIIAHPHGSHGLGREYRTQAFGTKYFRHLNDLRRILQNVKTPTPKFISGHTVSNLLLARYKCESSLAAAAQETEYPYYSAPEVEDEFIPIPNYVEQQIEWEEPPKDFRSRRSPKLPPPLSLQADTSLDRFDGEYFGFNNTLESFHLLNNLPQQCAETAFLHLSFHVESNGLQASLPLKIHFLVEKFHPFSKTYFSKTKFTNESPIFLHAQMLQ